MKRINNLIVSFTFIVVISMVLFSCKSLFPARGTVVECNDTWLSPIKNPSKKAEFNGGEKALCQFLSRNIRFSDKNMMKGKVRIAFVVTKEGRVCNVRVVSKVEKYINDEVIRVIKSMPLWTPAINNGEVVASYCLLDINLNKG